jgi:Family of unknown function (DUF6055)
MIIPLFLLIFSVQPVSFINNLENSYTNGEISLEQKLDYMEMSIKAPDELPLKYRELLKKYPYSGKSGTPLLLDVYRQKIAKNFKITTTFPPALNHFIESATLPIRVYYNDPMDETYVNRIIAAAEYGWIVQSQDYGFDLPVIDSVDNYFYFYLEDEMTSGIAGYCAPIGAYEPTAHDDCVVYIAIGKNLSDVESTVVHELNHAMQASTDCMEPVAYWENTSTFVELIMYPEQNRFLYMSSWVFQEKSHRSISAGSTGDYYWYSGFLWNLFLTSHYGESFDDFSLIGEIWQNCKQTNGYNEPDYFDAIDTVLKAKGFGGFEEAFHKFSLSRYFTGDNYKAEYGTIHNSTSIYPPLNRDELKLQPGVEFIPQDGYGPQQYGVNYLKISLSDADREYTLKFDTDFDDEPWYIQLVPFVSSYGIQTGYTVDGSITFTIDPDYFSDFVMIIERLGSQSFKPSLALNEADYTVNIDPVIPFPDITMVTPRYLNRGSTAQITIYGSGFQDGATINLVPEGQSEIINIDYVSESQIIIDVKLPGDALLGEYAIEVINPDNGDDFFVNAFFVMNAVDSGTDDGICSSTPAKQTNFPLIPLLLFGFLISISVLRKKRNS